MSNSRRVRCPLPRVNHCNMRQEDFSKGRTVTRLRRKRLMLQMALSVQCTLPLLIYLLKKVKANRIDLKKINLRTRTTKGITFNVNIYNEASCLRDFRFRSSEIPVICSLFNWDHGKTARSRYRCDPITASCIVLRRLASPCRWADLEYVFGMHSSHLSEIFWEVLETFYASRHTLITSFRSDLIQGNRASILAELVCNEGAPLDNCIGFIDCTKIQICRPGGPSVNQRSVYSGHKRFHCSIYQTITTPDGLVFHVYGPEEGRRHDLTLYRKSNMDQLLQNHLLIDRQYCIYEDAAYMLRPWLQVAYPREIATQSQQDYNKHMSSVREAVEWSYKEIKLHFTSQDMKRKLKARESPISVLYICSVLLFNFKTCLGHGGQVPSRFESKAPTLEEYTNPPQKEKRRRTTLRELPNADFALPSAKERGLGRRPSRKWHHSVHGVLMVV